MRRTVSILALLLPIAGIAAGIARNEIALARAQEWVIPIAGYDPRDLLRGHYIAFRYLWQVEGDTEACRQGRCLICLETSASGTVVAQLVSRGDEADCPARVDMEASHISPDFASRIFVPESKARELEDALREAPMQVVTALRRDGVLVNLRLEPVSAE